PFSISHLSLVIDEAKAMTNDKWKWEKLIPIRSLLSSYGFPQQVNILPRITTRSLWNKVHNAEAPGQRPSHILFGVKRRAGIGACLRLTVDYCLPLPETFLTIRKEMGEVILAMRS